MTLKQIIRRAGLALAVGSLAACGGAENTDTAAAEPIPPAAFVTEPTITPNAAPLDSAHPNSIQPETTLSISATGSVDVAPDIAFITTGVTSEAKTAAKAMADNRSAMSGVFQALKASGVDDRDMQTSNFSMQPQYDYSSRNGPPKLTGYTASNQLSVRVRDLSSLGETLDALVDAGGNTFSGLRFALDDDRGAKNQARSVAMKDAIARAELYANASGYEVARIVTISENASYAPQPAMMMEARSMSADSTSIASGEVGYSITVNVVFELRQ